MFFFYVENHADNKIKARRAAFEYFKDPWNLDCELFQNKNKQKFSTVLKEMFLAPH